MVLKMLWCILWGFVIDDRFFNEFFIFNDWVKDKMFVLLLICRWGRVNIGRYKLIS